MKKFLAFLFSTFLVLTLSFSLVGCDLFGDGNGDGNEEGGIPQIENSVDISEFTPAPDDDTEYIDGETYYTSSSIDLVTEINGNYTVDRPFTLDKENENKRIFHNIYFYVGDFFQVIYYKDITQLGTIFAALSDETDTQYAKVTYSQAGKPLQIDIVAQGIYNLILDTQTFEIDMIKVGDITTPVYETIKYCELYVHTSSATSYTKMTLDTTTNEYYIEKDLPVNCSLGFFNESHTGRYKMTVDSNLDRKYTHWNSSNPVSVQVHVGGTYKIYFNSKTYVLRLELQNPNTANYFCQVGFNENNILSPVSQLTPYLFEYTWTAEGTRTDPYVEIPSFYPELGFSYTLTVNDVNGYVFADTYVTESGTYKLTINLLEFTLSVEKI